MQGKESRILDYKLEAYNRAVYHSVTTDGEKVYAKLVNADAYEKKVEIVFAGSKNAGGAQAGSTAEWICLTGEEALVHEPNVNVRGAERVAPVSRALAVKGGKVTLTLPANSVSVVVKQR